jgi:hypothetical protein
VIKVTDKEGLKMPRFIVEVTQPESVAAKRIDQAVRSIGSHFATHAAWRRENGAAIGTMVVEADDRWGAFGIVPPGMRSAARIFELGPAAAPTIAAVGPAETSTEPYAVAA